MSRPSRASARRRLLPPLLILLVGGALAVWGSQQQTQKQQAIRQMVYALCEAASRNTPETDLAALVPAADAMLEEPVAAALREACGSAALESIGVSVRTGDAEGFRGATHLAVISILEVPRLGLRVDDSGQRAVIIGYVWMNGR